MISHSERALEIFTEAVQLSVEDREVFLAKACAFDEGLRQMVEALLKSNDRAENFLKEPPTVSIGEERDRVAGEMPGDRIGRYTLLQQIGEGGFGVVFMAEQKEPVHRRVALKIIKPGMDTKAVIARFEAERQALALMDHPNIAKVFDAGATESGRPYFVMELVRGVKITEYCDQNSLSTEERLTLFIQVCQAVQHAHQKGIIHRDIKPSNILVTTTSESVASPVVIDFGIAKATTSERLTEKTLFTAREMLIGTPAYMSPEQAALTGAGIDTRTDIYSLGVLLYELLSGSTPFDTTAASKSGLDEIRRVILEEEPIRPSMRLSRLAAEELTKMALMRRSEPATFIRAIHGDLDWIVMKALEKDRARRYPTASDLALDIQRFLANETIFARPPSQFYRFQKAVARHRVFFTAITVIALFLIISLIVVSTSLAKERRSRLAAQAASVKSEQVTKFLEEMLNGVDPSVARGEDTKMLQGILDQTAVRIGKEMTNQPAVEAELRDLIGTVYYRLGNYQRAAEMHRAAVAIQQRLFGQQSGEAATALNVLGRDLLAERKLSEAESVVGKGLSIRRRLLGETNGDTATSLNDLSAVYRDEGRFKEAETMAGEALGIRQTLDGTESLDAAKSFRNLCIILGDEGKFAEAETNAQKMLAIRRKLLGPEDPEVASALADAGWAAKGAGDLGQAEAFYRECLEIRLKLLGPDHPDSLGAFQELSQTLIHENKWTEAESPERQALAGWRKRAGNEDPQTLEVMGWLCWILENENKWPEVEALHREILETRLKLLGPDHPDSLSASQDLSLSLAHEGKWTEAESLERQALAGWRKRGGDENPKTLGTMAWLCWIFESENKWPEAEALQREIFAYRRKVGGNEDFDARVAAEALVRELRMQKNFTEEERFLNEVLTPAFVRQPSSATLLSEKVRLLGCQGRWPEALSADTFLTENLPDEVNWDHDKANWYYAQGGLMAITRDRSGYEQLCQKLIAKYGGTANIFVAERTAQVCVLLPDSQVDLLLAEKLADTAVTGGSGDPLFPYFQECKAMVDYRSRNFPGAIEWADKASKSPIVDVQAQAYAVLAMAQWQLGHSEEARAMLAKGNHLMPTFSPGRGPVDLADTWIESVSARVFLNEAADLIHPESANNQK